MAINEVIFPTVPNPVSGDWALAIDLVTKGFQNINSPLQVDGSNIPQGATFQVGGHVYHADADTAISGTASDYVQLAVSGTTLVPSFVTGLTGVTWNKIYNGYYDASGYLYLFDEVKAILAGVLAGGYSKFAELWMNNAGQGLKSTDSPIFGNMASGSNNNQDVRTTVSPTFAGLTVNGNILPRNPATDGNWQVSTTPIIIPRGLYVCNMIVGGSIWSYIQMYNNSTWFTIATGLTTDLAPQNGITIISDGVNFRVLANTASFNTMYYRKF